MERNSYLELNHIDVHYGKLQALWDISVYVGHKEMVTLIGANGAGKSTLLRAISGLHRPTKGKIIFMGDRIENKTTQSIVELGVCMVPEGRKLFDEMSTFENLEMGAILSRAKKARDENLDLVYGLFPILRSRGRQLAGTLSGGEQQMLAMGRALMTSPRILLMDEPSMGLAPVLVDGIFDTIRQLHAGGTPILLVEQNARMALQVASRGYVLQSGVVVLSDTAENLRKNEMVRKAYLGET